MIKPEGIPLLAAVQPDTVDDEAGNLKKTAGEIRATGANVHSSWQGLAGFYSAPEAAQLFAATAPVRTRADTFADQLERVTTALTAYAAEVRPIKQRLTGLSGRAWAFKSKADAEGDDWDRDEDLVEENNDLVNQVGAQVMAFQAAQDRAAAAIYASYGAAPPAAQKGQEGKATEPPWGTPEKGDLPWYKDALNSAGSLFKGFFADGLGGDLTGLWDLVTSPSKWWGTFKTIMTLSLPLLPFGFTLLAIPAVGEKFLKSWKDFGKSFVAWDEWKKDPARALGNTFYNAITVVVPYTKAGTAGKVAKAANAANKTADVLDPLSLAAKGAGKLPKVGEIARSFDFRTGNLLGEIKLDPAHFRIAENPELPADLDRTPDLDRVPEPAGAPGHEINAPERGPDIDRTTGGTRDPGEAEGPHGGDPGPGREGGGSGSGGPGDRTPAGQGGDGPGTPENDPKLPKSHPQVAEQVETIREQIGERLQAAIDDAWERGKERLKANEPDLHQQDPTFTGRAGSRAGTFAHTELAKWIDENAHRLVNPDNGYRLRTEINFDVQAGKYSFQRICLIGNAVRSLAKPFDPTSYWSAWPSMLPERADGR